MSQNYDLLRFRSEQNEVWVIAYESRFLYNVLARKNLRPIKTFETTDFVVSAQSNDFADYTDFYRYSLIL